MIIGIIQHYLKKKNWLKKYNCRSCRNVILKVKQIIKKFVYILTILSLLNKIHVHRFMNCENI